MKQKRKTLGICCLILCILLQCFLLQPVSVLAAPSASVSVSSSTVNVGDTVTVTVTFSGGGAKMGAVDAQLTYDSSLLTFVSGDNANEASKGTVLMVGYTTSTSGSDAFAFSLTFQAQKAGSVTLRASTTEFGTIENEVVENVSASKSLTVQEKATPTPTKAPTPTPTKTPTKAPTPTKTKTPTKTPSPMKTPTPTETAAPTETPTETPTVMPTITPDVTTEVPTEMPSETPTQEPESSQTTVPADVVTETPQDAATPVKTATATIPKKDNSGNGMFSVQAAFLFCAIGMFLVGGTVGFILCYVIKSKR